MSCGFIRRNLPDGISRDFLIHAGCQFEHQPGILIWAFLKGDFILLGGFDSLIEVVGHVEPDLSHLLVALLSVENDLELGLDRGLFTIFYLKVLVCRSKTMLQLMLNSSLKYAMALKGTFVDCAIFSPAW
jgi:hypothetical protein